MKRIGLYLFIIGITFIKAYGHKRIPDLSIPERQTI